MTSASQIYAALQRLARAEGRPFSEYLTLYAMECFLARLAHTTYKDDVVLKGGVLLAAYKLRRPTRDIDMEAVDFPLDQENMKAVVVAVADAVVEDALTIDPSQTTVDPIRDGDEYSGLRVKIASKVHGSAVSFHLDISTGDPIWPAPQTVDVPRLLGGSVQMSGYPIPMIIAEKSVTILSRGAASTRWRDVVDIRSFAATTDFTAGELRKAIESVADHREVPIASIKAAMVGWAGVAQPKWAAWRRKFALESSTREQFSDQLMEVGEFLDPVFTGRVLNTDRWSHITGSWDSESSASEVAAVVPDA